MITINLNENFDIDYIDKKCYSHKTKQRYNYKFIRAIHKEYPDAPIDVKLNVKDREQLEELEIYPTKEDLKEIKINGTLNNLFYIDYIKNENFNPKTEKKHYIKLQYKKNQEKILEFRIESSAGCLIKTITNKKES